MDWDLIPPMIISVVFILAVAGVILLRPLSKRLGQLLEAMTEERHRDPQPGAALSRIRESLDAIDGRLSLLEERQDFTDDLLGGAEGRRLSRGDAEGAEAGRMARER